MSQLMAWPRATTATPSCRLTLTLTLTLTQACLAKGEDGYTELQAVYDDGLTVKLAGEEMAEAKRILELIKDSQRHYAGAFDGFGWREKASCPAHCYPSRSLLSIPRTGIHPANGYPSRSELPDDS